jgi:plastocyanin
MGEVFMMLMKKTLTLPAGLLLALFAGACGSADIDDEDLDELPGAEATEAVTRVDPATAATVTGKVFFEGDLPRARRLDMAAEPACAAQHTQAVYSEVVVPNENETLRHVFVYVKEGLEGKVFATPTQAAILDQKGCVYRPHMLGVQVNQPIRILNSDPTTHNIHPTPKNNREWNESMAPGMPPKNKKFPRQEVMISVKCNVHPWMKTYIGVLPHPFFSVTGEDGSFEITGLPPGEYTLEVWHEFLNEGVTTQKVTLAASESKSVEFTLKQAS